MFINFGHGKCPLCGDFGSKIENKKAKPVKEFKCEKCNASFDDFCLYLLEEPKEQNKFWN